MARKNRVTCTKDGKKIFFTTEDPDVIVRLVLIFAKNVYLVYVRWVKHGGC